jgi:hypothetical protein
MVDELRPAGESVCPRDHELRLRQRTVTARQPLAGEVRDLTRASWRVAPFSRRPAAPAFENRVDPFLRPAVNVVGASAAGSRECLCALAVMLDVGTRRQRQGVLRVRVHANLLSTRLESALIRLKEGSCCERPLRVGKALFAD